MKRYNDKNYKNYSQEITLVHAVFRAPSPKASLQLCSLFASQHRALPQYYVSFIRIVL